jgi:hypothetical protein
MGDDGVGRSPRQRWGTCCPFDPACDHSYLDDAALARWFDSPITNRHAHYVGCYPDASLSGVDQTPVEAIGPYEPPEPAPPAARATMPADGACAGHKHSPTLGSTICGLCERFIPDAELAPSATRRPE